MKATNAAYDTACENSLFPERELRRQLRTCFNKLIRRKPELESWLLRVDPGELLVEIFDQLEKGIPLVPPDDFVRDMHQAVDKENWEFAVAISTQWAQSHGLSLTEEEAEGMTQGLLWSTLLLRHVKAK